MEHSSKTSRTGLATRADEARALGTSRLVRLSLALSLPSFRLERHYVQRCQNMSDSMLLMPIFTNAFLPAVALTTFPSNASTPLLIQDL